MQLIYNHGQDVSGDAELVCAGDWTITVLDDNAVWESQVQLTGAKSI